MKRFDAGFPRLVLAVLLSLSFAASAHGQLGKGVVQGTVTDPTGASIPSATVALVNEGTGVTRTVETNAAGPQPPTPRKRLRSRRRPMFTRWP